MDIRAEEIKAKIIEGLEKSFQKLLRTKIRDNGELIFSVDGKIVRISGKELEKLLK